jgi:predicted nucleic acid-binding protein
MSGLEFIDTNVLVYAFDTTNPHKRNIAAALIERLWLERKGSMSVQVMQEFLYTITRKVKQPLSVEQAIAVLEPYQVWAIHAPTSEDVFIAAKNTLSMRVSFWDSMILHSATQLDCKILWSEDLNHGQKYGSILVQNPFLS